MIKFYTTTVTPLNSILHRHRKKRWKRAPPDENRLSNRRLTAPPIQTTQIRPEPEGEDPESEGNIAEGDMSEEHIS